MNKKVCLFGMLLMVLMFLSLISPAFAHTTTYCTAVWQPTVFVDNLYVDGHSETWRQWVHGGYSPYLDNEDSSYIATPTTGTKYEGWFTYADCNSHYPGFESCALGFYAKSADYPDFQDGFDVYDKNWNFIGSIIPTSLNYAWYWLIDIGVFSKSGANDFKCVLVHSQLQKGDGGESILTPSNVVVDASKLVVNYDSAYGGVEMEGIVKMHRCDWNGTSSEYTNVWSALAVVYYGAGGSIDLLAEVGMVLELEYPAQKVHNVGVYFTWKKYEQSVGTHTDWLGADWIDDPVKLRVFRESPIPQWTGQAYYSGSWHDIYSFNFGFAWSGQCVSSIESWDYFPLTGQSGAKISEWSDVYWNFGYEFCPCGCSGTLQGVECHYTYTSWYSDINW